MRFVLALALLCAAPLTAQLPTPIASTQPTPAPVQEWGCGGLPGYEMIVASPTRMIMQMEIAVRDRKCLGVASRVRVKTATRYRVDWMPCRPGQPWRRGDDFGTMSAAMVSAARPPACPPTP
jgi:hypothetical protein